MILVPFFCIFHNSFPFRFIIYPALFVSSLSMGKGTRTPFWYFNSVLDFKYYSMCMSACILCVCPIAMDIRIHADIRRENWTPGTAATDGSKPPCGHWELKLGTARGLNHWAICLDHIYLYEFIVNYVCTYVQWWYIHVYCACRVQKTVLRFFRTGVIGSCKLLTMDWELNLAPMEEKRTFS